MPVALVLPPKLKFPPPPPRFPPPPKPPPLNPPPPAKPALPPPLFLDPNPPIAVRISENERPCLFRLLAAPRIDILLSPLSRLKLRFDSKRPFVPPPAMARPKYPFRLSF